MRKLLLIPVTILATVLGLAPPAHAAASVAGPLTKTCRVAGKLVIFSAWVRYPTSTFSSFSVYRVSWSTDPSFRPSRVAISVKKTNGDTPLVRAWGGSQTTLADVGSTGDTGANWGTTQYSTSTHYGPFAKFYLNGSSSCTIPVINVQP